jgi:hypothetical protein
MLAGPRPVVFWACGRQSHCCASASHLPRLWTRAALLRAAAELHDWQCPGWPAGLLQRLRCWGQRQPCLPWGCLLPLMHGAALCIRCRSAAAYSARCVNTSCRQHITGMPAATVLAGTVSGTVSLRTATILPSSKGAEARASPYRATAHEPHLFLWTGAALQPAYCAWSCATAVHLGTAQGLPAYLTCVW